MVIEVKAQNIHGHVRFLPAGDAARTLAALLQMPEFSADVLNLAAGRMQAEVVVVEGNSPAVAEALAKHMRPVTIH